MKLTDLVVRGLGSGARSPGRGIFIGRPNRSRPLESESTMADIIVRNTQSDGSDGRYKGGGEDGSHVGGGPGLVAVNGARVRLDGFEVVASSLTGVYHNGDSVLRTRGGEIFDNSCRLFAGAGTDSVDEWFDDVFLLDNGTDFIHEKPVMPAPPQFQYL